jgi:hypothetical protein
MKGKVEINVFSKSHISSSHELMHGSVGRSYIELTACEAPGRTELPCRSVPSAWHLCAQLSGEVTVACMLGSAVLPGPPEWCK